MDDGDELWFSFIMQNPTDTSSYANNRLMFYLGSQDADPGNRDMLSAGHGLGVEITPTGNGGGKPRVRGIAWEGATTETLGTRYEFPNGPSYPGTTTLIVGKITWGATSDTLDIYAPDTALNLGDPLAVSGTPITLAANVDQSLIDRLYIGGKKDSPIIDEIRIGATYEDVISGTGSGSGGPTEADNTVSFADFSSSIGYDPTGGAGGIGRASGSFAGFTGGSYTVEWSPDLVTPFTPIPGTWPVAGTGASGGAGVQIAWSYDTTDTKAFFRLKIAYP
jgi:hypothetical protein